MGRGRTIGNLGRAPVPEWEELARAAWPGRVPSSIAKAAASLHLPVLLLSVLSLLAAAWTGSAWLGLVAWLAGAAVDGLAVRADPPTTRLLELVGVRAPYRGLLRSLPALAVVFVAVGTGPALAYLTVVLFIQLAWLAQPALATWLWRGAPPLTYLPETGSQPTPLAAHARCYARAVGMPPLLFLAELLALAAVLLVSTTPAALALAVLGGAIAVGYLLWTGLQAQGLRRRQPGWADELIGHLRDLSPVFLVYVSLAARQSKYIVNQWLPALDALPDTGLLLVREASQLAPLAATRHPVVYASSNRQVELLTVASIRVAFYLAYGERNTTLLREPRLRHVMLAHGDSDKATSASALIRAFDETWVAGRAAIDRFAAAGIVLPPERFAVIGRPQAVGLPVGPSGREPRVVLYAPTFEGYYEQTSHSSLDVFGVDLVRRLVGEHPEVRVWFRPHPASGVLRPTMLAVIDQIERLLRSAGDGHLVTADAGLSLTDCLAGADVLAADVSSVISDYLFTERPVIVCDPAGLTPEEFVVAYPSQAGSYLLGPDLSRLDGVLGQALGPDPLQAARIAMKEYVLGDPAGGPQAAFAANVRRLCAASPRLS